MRTEVSVRRVGTRRNHDLQDMQTHRYSTMLRCRTARQTTRGRDRKKL
jgi:hypothetical protein